jgi:hypothetical protein
MQGILGRKENKYLETTILKRKSRYFLSALLFIYVCRIFIKQVFALGDQVGHNGRIRGFIFPPIHKLPIGPEGHPENQHHHPAATKARFQTKLLYIGPSIQKGEAS